ncbi:hypothetical protein PUN28_001691 [Cardiocondyla obscurior]|uniref:N-acetyltransferase ESCO2 n=1 Tax=Cardiocondyla obscurior TaxID=286306 RepID=A0AAW2GQR9_9HYME
MDSCQGKLLCTPRRAQKCLFASSSDKSDKKSISHDSKQVREDKSLEDESDLGPMSPLALSDQSSSASYLSSPGREFVSPFATPEKSAVNTSWDRLRFTSEDCMSPFRSLKKVTRAARYSPRCKFVKSNSPKSLPSTPDKLIDPSTPQRLTKMRTENNDEIVPETPPRNFATEIQNENITDTPRKIRSPVIKQITPLNSISKTVPLPKVHRRKSFSAVETNESFSPEQKENVLKRCARDHVATRPTKLFKGDDGFVSKARASLFQEKKNERNSLNDFSLSTKTFYSGSIKFERPFDDLRNSDIKRRQSLPLHSNIKRRQSLPSYNNGRRSLMAKKQRFGKINAGVYHNIKKPKPKVNVEIVKKEEQQKTAVLDKNLSVEEAQPMEANAIVERPLTPMVDETKRFFKTNKTIRLNRPATVTVNKNIKLKVTDGKIALKENLKHTPSANAHKQYSKVVEDTLDTTDLTVDEPEIEAMLEQDKVADLLKTLKDDWENDEYDTMAPLTQIANAFSPLASTTMLPKDTIMSPATELTNMTSTMNIKDITPLNNFENLSLDSTNNNNDAEKEIGNKDGEKSYFPLFRKGYSVSDNIFEETSNVNSKKTSKNMKWQLSTKGGGADDQYVLDAGQKRFGAIQCLECNVVYEVGNAEDENAHLNYHNSIRILKFQGWKNERIILEDPFTSSKIILIEPRDSKQHWKKVLEILAVVDRDLGLSDMNISDYQTKKIYLYVREKNVLGVLVAEHLEKAFRMIPELIDLNCCTVENTPTKCGVNVVWTAMSHRRQGIATKLVDTLRANFFYGYVMSLDDIAFSVPTPSGKIFAEKYTKTKNFKVYN